jgi:lathosterol oxidase
MDVVLEVFDTLLLDYVYSVVLPASSHNLPVEWRYTPATRYLTLTPGVAAFSSVWSRDNIFRQAVSLFFITWFVEQANV